MIPGGRWLVLTLPNKIFVMHLRQNPLHHRRKKITLFVHSRHGGAMFMSHTIKDQHSNLYLAKIYCILLPKTKSGSKL